MQTYCQHTDGLTTEWCKATHRESGTLRKDSEAFQSSCSRSAAQLLIFRQRHRRVLVQVMDGTLT
jgi:hypothetical protein